MQASAPDAAAAQAVAPDIWDARLHVVTGKGGTGKTTCAAALATALAAGGRRVLIIEVEGRQGLAHLFDTPPLPYRETLLAHAAGRGEVYGLAVDPELAMLEYLEMFYNLKRAGRALRSMGAIDFVTTIAPGLRDVLLTGKVKEAVTRTVGGRTKSRRTRDGADAQPAYDAVVLDAPPTGRIRPFLDVTKDVAGLTKVGPIHRQSQGVIDLLHSRRTRVHLVTLLEELPVQETLDAAGELTAAGFHLGAVLINRTRPDLLAGVRLKRGRPDRGELADGVARAGVSASSAPALAREVADYAKELKRQRANANRLAALDRPAIELPELGPADLGTVFDLANVIGQSGSLRGSV
jgi:anion-transporting  ArsA/GET3 family ATPase